MSTRIVLGSHMSISGGMHTAFTRGASIGCTTMQVFTKSNSRWTGPPHTAEEITLFKSTATTSAIRPVVAHAAYLINLCASGAETLRKSRVALIDELERCETMGILGLIVHPGAHVGAGEADGIQRIAESLNRVHDATPGFRTLTILETTAGQGSSVGYRFEHLREILDSLEEPDRTAVCFDTCHVFAAGYDISSPAGWESTFRAFDEVIGLEHLAAIHVNDSLRERGSRIDRHAHIGKGKIGLAAFRMLMNDPRLIDVPKILETAKSNDMHEDVENMNILRSLVD